VDEFLAEYGLSRQDIGSRIIHTGGPKVLQAVESALELKPAALEASWASLARVGNLSSASVLVVLEEHLAHRRAPLELTACSLPWDLDSAQRLCC
jgi:alkylresorcinol/alkylpyrone synthase